jgi:hypothetical protein
VTTPIKEARDFTYIKPEKRRLSEYEAVNLYLQPAAEPGGWDGQGGFTRTPDGRYAWETASTALKHPHWWDFRDPSRLWQRPYMRMQAEQERAIERLTDDVVSTRAFEAIDPRWLTEVLAGHYAVWSFVEWGIFRALLPPSREALSETIGTSLLFEGFDRVRHSQDIVRQMMAFEEALPGFDATGAKEAWLSEPRYQPIRKVVEELMFTVTDWAETAVAINLVFDPILGDIGVSRLVGRPAPFQGDALSGLIVASVDRDRARNLAWTQALVRMATAADVPDAAANRAAINGWVARWTGPVTEAVAGLAPLHTPLPRNSETFSEIVTEVVGGQRKMLAELGLEAGA